jgi:uncharacterized membrane protein
VYLFPLCLLPFGAALISRFDREAVALRMYGLVLLLIAVTRLAVWLYGTNPPLIRNHQSPVPDGGALIAVVPAVLYIIAILISESSPTGSLAIYAAVPVVYFMGLFLDRSIARPGSGEDDYT